MKKSNKKDNKDIKEFLAFIKKIGKKNIFSKLKPYEKQFLKHYHL